MRCTAATSPDRPRPAPPCRCPRCPVAPRWRSTPSPSPEASLLRCAKQEAAGPCRSDGLWCFRASEEAARWSGLLPVRRDGAGFLQLLIDDALEGVQRLGAHERPAVDEERRGAAGAQAGALGGVRVDLRRELVLVQRGLELADVQVQLLRVLLQGRAVQRALVGEELVVHLPELALLVRGQRGGRGGLGVGMHGQRLVLEGDLHLAAVLVLNLLERRDDAAAEGALE